MKAGSRAIAMSALIVSHAVSILLGALVADTFWGRRSPIPSLVRTLKHLPVSSAAHLAFRFGTAEDARSLLTVIARSVPEDALAWGDVMIAEIRLGVLDGEHDDGVTTAPHLHAAVAACTRFRHSGCELDGLRALANKVAAQRTH